MGTVTSLFDGLRNVVANLGTSRDKASHTGYHFQPIPPETLRAAYRSSWLPRKIVDIPAFDAVREWRSWSADPDQISALEAEEQRLGVKGKVRDALVASRLYGGSAILIGTGDEDLKEPLNPDAVGAGGLRYLTVLDRRDLVPGEIDYSPSSHLFGMPKWYELTTDSGELLRIHPTRLALFHGSNIGDSGATRIEPWGDSVLQSVFDAVRHTDATVANVASLVFEAKVDTIGIPKLHEMLADKRNETRIQERLSLVERAKSINGTLVHDAEEVIGQKKASFASLENIMDRFFQAVSGAADIPMTRLFGQSPAGLSSTGESDQQNYYDRIGAIQRLDISPRVHLLDEVLIRSALGDRPPEVYYEWRSLWQPSEKERAEIGLTIAQTAKTLAEGEIMPLETIGAAATNALIEFGAMPGLEAAIHDHGMDIFDPRETD